MEENFDNFKISKQLHYAIEDLGFKKPTQIQEDAFSVIRSGRDVVGTAQTGTGKTFAYMLPLLEGLKFSKQDNPRILILVPTRELVGQLVENIQGYAKYMSVRVTGVFGGVNINPQKEAVAQGLDILVGTPGRLNDLILSRTIQLKSIKHFVVDEVDVMLDLGFRHQLTNILDMLPQRRQNILFSATMTDDVSELIDSFFTAPERITVALSGEPLENIEQVSYAVPNFYTKANLLIHLLKKTEFKKVLIFVSNKKSVERLQKELVANGVRELDVIHSNKTQNYRLNAIKYFEEGKTRILIATDVMARGVDLDQVSHAINFDVPSFPENYMHRIGRTGRAGQEGHSLLLYTPKEQEAKEGIEQLMKTTLPIMELPEEIEIATRLAPEERPEIKEANNPNKPSETKGASFHEKKEKNQKTNQGGSYRREIAKKYKKPKTRGDKNYNRRNKK
ncbi:DEAD/DEAH box helicase [Flavimarina sp. Hel_I_48]|uniref:DEAD/DEAH box helicase n=1 Tax=Flavimarina sp. Hel_I_48 TaxID=1392488 RepID=UPI0004DF5B59|nr:DEAD/DEAH box helicase [Flavimarina sp. Hel_I_48]